jgi:uncharacterized membrane protein YkgB
MYFLPDFRALLKPTIMSGTVYSQVNQRYLSLLRISIGVIYVWFGVLKFFHGYSPAEDLAAKTIARLTFSLLSDHTNLILLATWECIIGLLFIAGKWMRLTLICLLIHMACTFTPLLFFPSVSFNYVPYGFTLVGQYIMKNIVIVSASLILWQQQKERLAPHKLSGQ